MPPGFVSKYQVFCDNFHIRTLHFDSIKVLFTRQPMHQRVVSKTILKFTLKQLRRVSVLQLHHHQGAH